MPLVGLTGGLATGKSLVSSMFVKLGAALIDCDILAREVTEPGQEALAKVVERFGESVLRPDGSLDRSALAKIVFSDPVMRETLEGILHPIIIDRVIAHSTNLAKSNKDTVIVVDAALLFESGLDRRMEKNIVVVCDPDKQMERALVRDGSTEEQARLRIEAQWPLSEKRAKADYIIDNSGSHEETLEQASSVWVELLRL